MQHSTTSTAAGPWPEIIMRSFSIAAGSANPVSEKSFYGSWNRLLNTVFPANTRFEVVPQNPPTTSHETVDLIMFLVVYIETTPVFIVEIKPPEDLRLRSKRQEADEQLRRWFGDVVPDLKSPVLHGVSAFGSKIAFYEYSRDNHRFLPRRIREDPEIVSDVVPREWWTLDIMEEEGAKKFCDVVEEVKEICGHVSFQ